MQTALHIYSLVKQIEQEVIGSVIVETAWYRKARTAILYFKGDKKRKALSLEYHPAGFGISLLPASKIAIDTNEKPRPFFDLIGFQVESVQQLGLDRLLRLTLSNEGRFVNLLIEAIGPNSNIWLLDSEFARQGTLRKQDYKIGELYEPPSDSTMRIDPFICSNELLSKLFDESGGRSIVDSMSSRITGFNKSLAREAIKRSELDLPDGEISKESISALSNSVQIIANNFNKFEPGYRYEIASKVEVYPFKLSSVDVIPEKFKTLSLAVQDMTSKRRVLTEEKDEKKTTISAVNRAVKRLERRLVKLESDIESASQFDTFKKYAELLQIHRAELKRGMDTVTLPDHFGEGTITIPLDKKLSPGDNIEGFFKKYRKGKLGLDLLKRRLEISKAELHQLNTIRDTLETDFENGQHRFAQEIASLLPRSGGPKVETVRLPYKTYLLTTGLTIFVGRDGSDNDRTTFDFSKPYELWFHTQQCPGSHVVLKAPSKSFEPSRQEIEETAQIAAFFSKARKDSLVPVIYTQRKYVRKPRGAKPGLVTVEREKSIMVRPQKPE